MIDQRWNTYIIEYGKKMHEGVINKNKKQVLMHFYLLNEDYSNNKCSIKRLINKLKKILHIEIFSNNCCIS